MVAASAAVPTHMSYSMPYLPYVPFLPKSSFYSNGASCRQCTSCACTQGRKLLPCPRGSSNMHHDTCRYGHVSTHWTGSYLMLRLLLLRRRSTSWGRTR